MMLRKLIVLGLIVLLVGGLFVMAGERRYERAWWDGYFAGQQTQGEDGGSTVVAPPGAYGRSQSPVRGGIFGFFFTGFLLLLGLVFVLGFLGRAFGFHYGRKGHSFWKAWQGPHGHRPPWCDDDEEQVMKA